MRPIALAILLGTLSFSAHARQSFDFVVYGGTAGGVMAAVSGARQGLKTVLLEPRRHAGGMATGVCPAPIPAPAK
jgi:glycerol-3-phosphate dehydrogenase